MSEDMAAAGIGRLERSCGPSPGDWLRLAPSGPGCERIEAYFSGHAFDPHRHDTYALGLTLSGVQRFDYRGAQADSLAGQLIALHPDEVHNGRAGDGVAFRYRMLYLEPRLVAEALGAQARALPFMRQAVLQDARLVRALAPLLRDIERPFEPLELESGVQALADALLALDPSARARRPEAACARSVERARAFLDAEGGRPVASGELEAVTGLSRFEIARQFRRRLGTSPYRYLTMRRLDRARALMRAGAPLAEAALAAGFADQSHMARQFKLAYGLSPGRWRRIQVATATPIPRSTSSPAFAGAGPEAPARASLEGHRCHSGAAVG